MSCDGYEKNHFAVGPWGGQNGARWDDGVHCTVRQLLVTHGAGIDSIQIEYDQRGSPVWSDKHGGSGGFQTEKIKLDYPDEFLTSISGTYGSVILYGPVLVRSLTFESNRKRYGPFGIEIGSPFSLPINGGKVVGFHGRSSWYLDSIGVYLRPLLQRSLSNNVTSSQHYVNNAISEKPKGYDIYLSVTNGKVYSNQVYSQFDSNDKMVVTAQNTKSVVSYGPWGGPAGLLFDDGVYTGVREIHLTRSGGVVSIRVCYDLNGQAVWGIKNGGSGGIRLDKVTLDYPFEVLTHITGYYGSTILRGPTVVKSLTFHTNKRKYGPFGDEQGISFSSASSDGIIVGFHGKKGWFVDSIGVHVLQGKPSKPTPSNSFNMRISEVVPPTPFGPRLWGGDGGKPWNDGIFSGVRKIFLTNMEIICSIQIEYDRNGQSIWSVKHGGSSEGTPHMIKFNYPHEVLNCVSGYYGSIAGDESTRVVKSLTFYSNRGKYGPYGEEMGTFFTSNKTDAKIVGFHGRSGSCIDAIGVHTQHWVDDSGPFKMMLNKIFTTN